MNSPAAIEIFTLKYDIAHFSGNQISVKQFFKLPSESLNGRSMSSVFSPTELFTWLTDFSASPEA